jgi:putative ABC transport system permease protein
MKGRMKQMLKIALRNVFRNRRRTLLSLFLIALGVAALFVARGFFDNMSYQLRGSAVDQYGHLQIADPRYWEDKSEGYDLLISKETLSHVNRILSEDEEVECYTTQLRFSGMIGTEKKSTIFMATGVEPGNEIGGFPIVQGRGLREGDQSAVIIGEGMAEKLGVDLGDNLTAMGTTVDGQYNLWNLQVAGIFDFWQKGAGDRLAFVPISIAQKMLNTDGVEKVVVRLRNLEATNRTAAELRETLAEHGLDLEVRTWSDLADFYHRVNTMCNIFFRFMAVAIFALVFFGILEVLTMSFFERMREIGTIRAIGTKRREVFRMFLSEGTLLGIIGGMTGVGLGCLLGWLVNSAGLTWMPPSSSAEVPLQIRILGENMIAPFLVAIFSTLISTLFPALKAARSNIVKALRYV